MKIDKLVGERFRNSPADATIESHSLMLRGGYIKNLTSGIFSLFTPMKRIIRKIENIIREEMDQIDGQEVQFPVVMPATIWQESGRYSSIGSEMVRFTDRNETPLVLGMTHEEAAVHLVRDYAGSYVRYPFMIYQIQTKFRDEARPRGGLIRVREFTMKDAYSFHTSQADLESYYGKCHNAYMNIFRRVGLPEVTSVASDSGMMGGNVSHEFMLLTPVGEDSIAVCESCDYRANMEAAECITVSKAEEKSEMLKLVHTPGLSTIEDVSSFLGKHTDECCKAVIYQDKSQNYIIVFIRGDLDVNEAKVTSYLKRDVFPAEISDDCELTVGFVGPHKLTRNYTVLYDKSLEGANNLVCGGNIFEYHYVGLDMKRDTGAFEYHDFAKIKPGGICPVCGKNTISIQKGIEVGNIFQLGTKYTEAMGMTYLDKDGKPNYPIMGCYGIGVGRLAASICEARHDEYGPIWPMSVAPWQVEICSLRSDDPEVKQIADDIYQKLTNSGIEVLYDDREVSAGVIFADADLLGIPLRLIISPRNIKNRECEIVSRDKKIQKKIPLSDVVCEINGMISKNFLK